LSERVLEFRRRPPGEPPGGTGNNNLTERLREMLEEAEAGTIRSCAIAYIATEDALFTLIHGADQGVCALLGGIEILKADVLAGQVEPLPDECLDCGASGKQPGAHHSGNCAAFYDGREG